MPLPVIANTIRCSAEGLMPNGHVWANVFHLRKTNILTYAAAIAAADPVIAAFWTNHTVGSPGWGYYAATTASVQQIRYLPLDGTSAETLVAHVQAGAAAADPLPENVALVVTLRTVLRGRSYRGRMYLGCITEGNNSGTGQPNAGMLTDLTAQFSSAFITNLVGTGVSLVVASYLHSTAQDVSAININNVWDTQRRRLRI